MKNKKKLIIITGATASGKSKLAFAMAREQNGEIVSVDSRQIYKNIPIFSGISSEEKQNHLVGFLDESETFSAGDFVKEVKKRMEQIWKRGKVPILVGGTSFYFTSLLYKDFLPEVPIDKVWRKSMEGKTNSELMDILREQDPERALSIDPCNTPRIIRSLEIVRTLGAVPKQKAVLEDFDISLYWIILPREVQNERVEKNFNTRMETGLLEEAGELYTRLYEYFLKESSLGFTRFVFPMYVKKHIDVKVQERFFKLGLCYKHIFKFWNEEITQQEFVELGIQEERKYAKRQHTYLKKFYHEIPESEYTRKKIIDRSRKEL